MGSGETLPKTVSTPRQMGIKKPEVSLGFNVNSVEGLFHKAELNAAVVCIF